MKIGDFLNRCINSSQSQINPVKIEIDKYNNEIFSINKKLNFPQSQSYLVDKISNIGSGLWMIILVFGGILGFFGFLPMQPFMLSMLFSLGIGYAAYKIIKEKVTNKERDERNNLRTDRNVLTKQVEACRDKINELDKILTQAKITKEFIKKNRCEDYFDKMLPTLGSQILSYIRKDISLISILYLASSGNLPNKIAENLTKNELLELKSKSSDIDRRVAADPILFFGEDYVKQSNTKVNNGDSKDVKKIPTKEPLLVFSEQGVVKVYEGEPIPRVRNYRSAKYREANKVVNSKHENNDDETKGRSR